MPSSPLVVTYENLLFWPARAQQQTAAAGSTHVYIVRLGQSSPPQMKLSSVWRLLLIILGRRSKRVGLVLACVWFSSERGCSENADSSLLESAVLCCIIGFFLRDHPTPFTTTVATGPATAEYQQHRVSTAHVAAAPGE